MAIKEAVVNIQAIIQYDDEEFDIEDIDDSVVVCFKIEDSICDTELFVPQNSSMEVVEYTEVIVKEN